MKTCKDCIHSHVCGITHTDSSEACANFLYEDDATEPAPKDTPTSESTEVPPICAESPTSRHQARPA